jgi:methionyl-tRNA formyltransferase
MRVVVFGSGSRYSQIVAEAIADRGLLAAAVIPGARGRWPRRWVRSMRIWRALRSYRSAIQRRKVPLFSFRSEKDSHFMRRLRALEADLIVVAAFPYIIPASVRDLAKQGALNVHPSLLPKHRGPDPLFWTFYCNDAETGSTIHWIVDTMDAGDVVAQESMSVRRGITSKELTEDLARLGAALTLRAIDDLIANRSTATPQDEKQATTEPLASQTDWAIDFAEWTADRLWHFLRGVGESHAATVRRKMPIGDIVDYTIAAPPRPTGTIEPHGSLLRIYTKDGWVTTRAGR